MINLVWLKRDLRVSDHRPLYEAANNGKPTLILYVIEPDYWQLEDTSKRQFQFIKESLLSLSSQLQCIGASLTVRKGDVVEILEKVHLHAAISNLYCHQETGNPWTYERDKRVIAWCKSKQVNYQEYQQQAVFRGHVNRDKWHHVAERWLQAAVFPTPTHIHTLLQHHNGLKLLDVYPADDNNEARTPQQGGLEAANKTRDSFFHHRINEYLYGISSPVKSTTSSSRLSPYLAYGVLSLRQVLQQAQALPVTSKRNKSGFLSRLYWHSHFVQKLESEPRYAEQAVHNSLIDMRANEFNESCYLRWSSGDTGVPFIDACMRMLIQTGWINFRMRAMLMAYSSYHLWLDWQKPAARLATLFVDYEPGIHYPQVQMQSGTTGINPFRIYNPVTQGLKYDPDGHFIRRYIPELDHVPDNYLHTPWLYAGLKDDLYAPPEKHPDDAAKIAREKISSFYKQHLDKGETGRVISTHASRKRATRRRNKSNTMSKNQLKLF
ncbi:FAD-binding domain-containing protein [Pseudoalteromonas sp. PS5]|uniref:cryptochrome/deoxyribodipyrimidine photo-lyase family protein n=1 Tax=Pseudoalteromonas sp. PS5 TaxID=1437473 RepID=UPI000FFF10FE|nr:FAD-binding domain-containing protein [Pseudoalteromonas sp. PS5]RXE96299.1 deoxyribodipyrimidine photo-lyase [Pseudoalteromonas sp. PS5]